MTMHSFHPDTHEHGLADDCPRCAELAAAPFIGLDDENLRDLYVRTIAWMADGEFPRSKNEASAMRAMEFVIVRVRALERAGAVLA